MSEACATTIVDLFQEFNALPVGETSECRVEIVHLYLFKRKNISKNIVFWDVQGLCGNRIEVLCKGEKIGGPLKSQVMDQALAVDIGSVVSVKGDSNSNNCYYLLLRQLIKKRYCVALQDTCKSALGEDFAFLQIA
eukprot:gene23497-28449_t